MSSVYDLSSSRTTRAVDSKPDRHKRFLPYLAPVKAYHSLPKTRKKKHSNKTRM